MYPIGTVDTVAEDVVSPLSSKLLLEMPGMIIKGSSVALTEIYALPVGGCYAAETSQVFNVESSVLPHTSS